MSAPRDERVDAAALERELVGSAWGDEASHAAGVRTARRRAPLEIEPPHQDDRRRTDAA